MTKDFFWSRVRKPGKAGSARTQHKDNCVISEKEHCLHERLCDPDSSRKDYDQFESDCDDESVQSMTSTCYDSLANTIQPEEDNRPANANNREE